MVNIIINDMNTDLLCETDLNNDGIIDILDIVILVSIIMSWYLIKVLLYINTINSIFIIKYIIYFY